MPTWTNEDGLLVRFPLDNGATEVGDGQTSVTPVKLVWEVEDATALGDTDTATVAGDRPFIPSGAVIRDAYFVVDTAFTSGGSAVLDVGLKTADGSTVNDDDGLITGEAVGNLTLGAVISADGAQLNTKIANDLYPTFTYDTAAFTAGAGKLVVEYEIYS